MSVVINLFDEDCNMNNTCRKFAVFLFRFLTMTFWHTDRAVRGFSRVLGWSLCKDIPSLFNDTGRTIWNHNCLWSRSKIHDFHFFFFSEKAKIETLLVDMSCPVFWNKKRQ